MLEIGSGCKLETERRRRGWVSGGIAVRLADDDRWYLPIISPALLASLPELRDELRSILDVTFWYDQEFRDSEADLNSYCDRMTAVARRLLGANYDLPDCTWQALMRFNEPVEMFNMIMALSFALDRGWGVWRPWLNAM